MNPETKRAFGFVGRYAANRRLSSPSGVIRTWTVDMLSLQSAIEPIVADGWIYSKSAAKPHVSVAALIKRRRRDAS